SAGSGGAALSGADGQAGARGQDTARVRRRAGRGDRLAANAVTDYWRASSGLVRGAGGEFSVARIARCLGARTDGADAGGAAGGGVRSAGAHVRAAVVGPAGA